MSFNAITRTTEHVIAQVTAVLDGTMIIPKTAVNMTMMILKQTRCAAHAKLLVYIFIETNFH